MDKRQAQLECEMRGGPCAEDRDARRIAVNIPK